MDIKIEDIVGSILLIIIFVLYIVFSVKYDSVVPGLAILWIGITLLLIGHSYLYKKKKRNMKLLKFRFSFLGIPSYIGIIFLSYQQIFDIDLSKNVNLLISVGTLLYLILIVIVELILKRKKYF